MTEDTRSAQLDALIARWRAESRGYHHEADYMDGCNGRPFDAGQRLDRRIKGDFISRCADELAALLKAPLQQDETKEAARVDRVDHGGRYWDASTGTAEAAPPQEAQ